MEIANQKERVSKRKSDCLDNTKTNVPDVIDTTTNTIGIRYATRSSNTKIAQYTCCICGATSLKNQLLKFKRVPTVSGYKILKNDKYKFSYYKKRFRRNIYLSQMKIIGTRRKLDGLRSCNQHVTRKETFVVPWKNMANQLMESTEILEVLVEENPDENPIAI